MKIVKGEEIQASDVSWDAVVRDFGSGYVGPIEFWLACEGETPIGFVQTYSAARARDGACMYIRMRSVVKP